MGSFAFRYACYSEFHWTPDVVASLPESEAQRLAVVFEEVGAYQYKTNKELERNSSRSHFDDSGSGGIWEEQFSFGGDDDHDYADRPDILYGLPIED